MGDSKQLVPLKLIENKIYLKRGQKVMLDRDLAAICRKVTKALKQVVKHNLERLPENYMLVLSQKEFGTLILTLKTERRGRAKVGFVQLAALFEFVWVIDITKHSAGVYHLPHYSYLECLLQNFQYEW
jgi:hypothetical protein